MTQYPILGLVGPSNSGKTTLIEAMVRRFPNQVAVLKSLTTRPRRGPEDDANYDFVSVEDLKKLELDGRLIQISEYAGNFYSNDTLYTNELLDKKIGITALVQNGVRNLRAAGYDVLVIRIIPKNYPGARDEIRAGADAERSKDGLDDFLAIENDFAQGGLEKTEHELAAVISKIFSERTENSSTR